MKRCGWVRSIGAERRGAPHRARLEPHAAPPTPRRRAGTGPASPRTGNHGWFGLGLIITTGPTPGRGRSSAHLPRGPRRKRPTRIRGTGPGAALNGPSGVRARHPAGCRAHTPDLARRRRPPRPRAGTTLARENAGLEEVPAGAARASAREHPRVSSPGARPGRDAVCGAVAQWSKKRTQYHAPSSSTR